MPRQSSRTPSSRRIIQDQETFDFSTPNLKVQANPVDAHVRQAGPSGSARALLAAFATGKEAYGEWKANKDEKDFEAGGLAQATGEEQDTSRSAAWITGYESMNGQAAVADLEDSLTKYHNENWQADEQTYAAGREQVLAGFLEGKSKAYLKNFVPQALKIEEAFASKYQEAQRNQLLNDMRTKAGKATRAQLNAILTNPELVAESPKILRQHLSEQQKNMKVYGMSRTQVSKDFIDAVGMRARLEGRPDLLAFATEPDESGMVLADNPELAENILGHIRAAEAAADAGVAAKEKAEKEARTQTSDDLERAIIEGLYTGDPNDKATRQQIQSALFNAGHPSRNKAGIALDPTRLEHLLKLHNDLNGGGHFATNDNMSVWTPLWVKAAEGKLDLAELEQAQGQLSEASYQGLVKENADAKQRAKGSGSGTPFDPVFNKQLTDFLAVVNPKNSMGGDMFAEGPGMVMDARYDAYSWYNQFVEKNKRPPDLKETHEALKILKDKYESARPAPPTKTNTTTSKKGAEAPTSGREAVLSRIRAIGAKNKKGE
jgi:hypothetical protein